MARGSTPSFSSDCFHGLTDVLGVKKLIRFLMERKTSFCFVLIFLSVGFSLTADQMFASMNTRQLSKIINCPEVLTFVGRRFFLTGEFRINDIPGLVLIPLVFSAVSLADQRHDGHMKTTPNFKSKPTPQSINYDLIKKGNLEREPWKTFSPSHLTPINVSINGTPCILFWAKRITIKFKSQPLLDLTDKTFGKEARVDVGHSNCSEENAMLSLKFGDIDNLKGLDIRFVLISYNRLSVQSWFSLHRVQILYNNSVQATFKATRIHAPSKYSYHCQHVSSLQRYDALLVPSSTNDISRLWEVTFIDFQIQGFNVKEGQFSNARDCASFFSPAILMGLAMSLILLLVLAYALHMLIHLKSLDRHYDRKASPAYFVPMKDLEVATEEKEPLRSHGHDCHEPRSPHICNIYV